MKLGKCEVWHFGSYRHLAFDFAGLGLALISGPTGSGKSTLPDMPCWILFDVTSKDGAVDDIRKWGCEGPTCGELEVTLPDGKITVRRTRGTSKQNDLFWIEEAKPEQQVRGKDINETQKKLTARLGVDAELYLTAAYFSQFSKADSFFIAKAKDRRELLERIADLALPVRLAERASEVRKAEKKSLDTALIEQAKIYGRVEQLHGTKAATEASRARWAAKQAQTIADLEAKAANFETEKRVRLAQILSKLEYLDGLIVDAEQLKTQITEAKKQLKQVVALKDNERAVRGRVTLADLLLGTLKADMDRIRALEGDECPTCLGPVYNPNRWARLAELEAKAARTEIESEADRKELAALQTAQAAEQGLLEALDELREKQAQNDRYLDKFHTEKAAYLELLGSDNQYVEQLIQARNATDPFRSTKELEAEIEQTEDQLVQSGLGIRDREYKITALTFLYDKSFELRGKLLEKRVRELEGETNGYLEKYFDAEIRVQFQLDADKLEVSIEKNGHEAAFRQLSGGQRCMLKLAFGLAIMRAAADRAGVHFPLLCFDEALNGLDDELKAKAFPLFQELETEHESILLIDHCTEFKNLFANQFHVAMVGDASEVVQHGTDAEAAENLDLGRAAGSDFSPAPMLS